MSLIHEALEKLGSEKKSPWKKPLTPEPVTLEKEQARTANTTVIYAITGALIFFFLAGLVYFFTLSKKTEKLSQASPQVKELSKRPSLLQNLSAHRFTLSGITRVGTDWTAIVDNRLVRMGESINGAKVLTIQEDEVVLDWNGETIHLTLFGDSSAHFTRLEASR